MDVKDRDQTFGGSQFISDKVSWLSLKIFTKIMLNENG